ncbi:hypothetical protein [Mycobacterium avium]|uniref:hypothetical protein n=1 Tax=Mycobacterium avium TaxID=1764 RepID=UPI0005C88FD7|nr:hypothetical protein [Mycobacterium avium]ATO61149.1 hypothetical protein BEP52_01590 [Mycobacterium avium subsp. hominissuis]ATO65708.1 hypothetical protein BJP78_01545 [Mycobacterium avium subsp. hominissuis]ATO70285.1 hypothetical protein BJP74_01575 [Mycobacterium avium subsp. hominissuis]PBJ29555.1 hypothetical protein BI294_25010 [Mycobacterium avium subsp. hominissuis]QBI69797.1 hypothetical protein EX350_22080 [Mycobacterium avium subsp. hominissuis]
MGSVADRRRHPERMNTLLRLADWLKSRRRRDVGNRTVGVGTVRKVKRQVFIEVVAVSGETFIGKLARCDADLDLSVLRPGLVVLVAFDPAAREELSLPDDVLAVHAAWVAAL